MKLKIYHSMSDESGGVEFIESSIIYPFIFISVSILLFIFLTLINKIIIYESLSTSVTNIYDSYISDERWDKLNYIDSISFYEEEKKALEKIEGKIFSNNKGSVHVVTESGLLIEKISMEHRGESSNMFFTKLSRSKVIDNKINQVDFLRKTDLVFDLAEEISNLEIKDKKIKDYFKGYKNKFENFIEEKIKK